MILFSVASEEIPHQLWNAEHPGFDMFFLGFLGLMSRSTGKTGESACFCIFPIINPGLWSWFSPYFSVNQRWNSMEKSNTPKSLEVLEHHQPQKKKKHLFQRLFHFQTDDFFGRFSDPQGWFLGGSSAIVLHQSSYWNQTALVEFVSHRLGCEARSSRCWKSGKLAFVEERAQTVV